MAKATMKPPMSEFAIMGWVDLGIIGKTIGVSGGAAEQFQEKFCLSDETEKGGDPTFGGLIRSLEIEKDGQTDGDENRCDEKVG